MCTQNMRPAESAGKTQCYAPDVSIVTPVFSDSFSLICCRTEGSHVEFSLYKEKLRNSVPREAPCAFGKKFAPSIGVACQA